MTLAALARSAADRGQLESALECCERAIATHKLDPAIHHLHATILALLGLDHEKLTFRYAGRDFRLTDVHGEVIRGIIA